LAEVDYRAELVDALDPSPTTLQPCTGAHSTSASTSQPAARGRVPDAGRGCSPGDHEPLDRDVVRLEGICESVEWSLKDPIGALSDH